MKLRKPIGIAVALVAVIAAVTLFYQAKKRPRQPAFSDAGFARMDGGLKYRDLRVGTGLEASPGRSVSVHYTSWLIDGTKLDSSLDRKQPESFRLRQDQAALNWKHGVIGMKAGGKRRLIIPPQSVFDIELLSVSP